MHTKCRMWKTVEGKCFLSPTLGYLSQNIEESSEAGTQVQIRGWWLVCHSHGDECPSLEHGYMNPEVKGPGGAF